jgi:hypothetical protein
MDSLSRPGAHGNGLRVAGGQLLAIGGSWPIDSLTAVQHHTRFWVIAAMEGCATSFEPGPLPILRFWPKPFAPGTGRIEQRTD